MQLGYIGLGKMGKNMVLHLLEKKHQVVAWNRSPEPRQEVSQAGARAVETVENLVKELASPRVIWLMLPSGETTDNMIVKLSGLLSPGDTVIYQNTLKSADLLKEKHIHFLDAGVSGGPAGARGGACVMVGGEQETFQKLEPLFTDIAAENAYRFFPGHGAGHFAKMVHNGIEYGMMQAIGEGFDILKNAPFQYDLKQVAELYNQQSVIESRLIGWLASGYQKHGNELEGISGSVGMLGEGQWTVETAKAMKIPAPVIEAALQFRINSTNSPSYTGKVVSTLRNEFGGHEVKEKN